MLERVKVAASLTLFLSSLCRPPDVPTPHQPDSGLLSTFIKTRSLREKFRDSKSWSIKRGSFQQAEASSPSDENDKYCISLFKVPCILQT